MINNSVQRTVHETAALGRAVHLGNVHILVQRHADRDVGEAQNLGQRALHDDDVHKGHTIQIPVAGILTDEMTVVVTVQDGTTEQAAGKLAILVVLELGQQGLVGSVLFVEAFDGLQHKGVDNLLVVVPIQTLVFEQSVEVGVVEDESLVELAPQFTVASYERSSEAMYSL